MRRRRIIRVVKTGREIPAYRDWEEPERRSIRRSDIKLPSQRPEPTESIGVLVPLPTMEPDAVDRRWGVSMVSTANLTSRAVPGSIPGRSSRVAASVAHRAMVCYVRLVRFADTSIPTGRLINEALRLIFDLVAIVVASANVRSLGAEWPMRDRKFRLVHTPRRSDTGEYPTTRRFLQRHCHTAPVRERLAILHVGERDRINGIRVTSLHVRPLRIAGRKDA